METNWILKDPQLLNSRQIMALYILFESANLNICTGLGFSKFPCKQLAMTPGRGYYITYYTGDYNEIKMFKDARWISYDELIEMLKREIKSKITDGNITKELDNKQTHAGQ